MMYMATIAAVSVVGDEYSITTIDGNASVWTRRTNVQIIELPSWNDIIADLIDQQGDLLVGKTITVDLSSASIVVVT